MRVYAETNFILELVLEQEDHSACEGILALAEQLHGTAVVLGVWEKNEKARAFYQTMGFTSTLDDPLCLYLPVSVLEKAKPRV